VKRFPLVLDFLFVLLFVSIGRSAHHHTFSVGGLFSTLWPFAVGVGAGWLAVALRGRAGLALSDGTLIVVITVALGMVLRVISGQGTAVAFIIVALAFLGLFLLGWRLIFQVARRRRQREIA
jgi:hypothetical protein